MPSTSSARKFVVSQLTQVRAMVLPTSQPPGLTKGAQRARNSAGESTCSTTSKTETTSKRSAGVAGTGSAGGRLGEDAAAAADVEIAGHGGRRRGRRVGNRGLAGADKVVSQRVHKVQEAGGAVGIPPRGSEAVEVGDFLGIDRREGRREPGAKLRPGCLELAMMMSIGRCQAVGPTTPIWHPPEQVVGTRFNIARSLGFSSRLLPSTSSRPIKPYCSTQSTVTRALLAVASPLPLHSAHVHRTPKNFADPSVNTREESPPHHRNHHRQSPSGDTLQTRLRYPTFTANAIMPSSTLPASAFDTIPDAIAAFRNGEFLVVLDDPSRENEADLIISAQSITTAQMAFMIRHSSGLICAPLAPHLTESLELPQMVPLTATQDSRGTAYTLSVDAADPSVTTGISAHDRALTCRTLAAKGSKPADLRRPGHVFPLRARSPAPATRASFASSSRTASR
ncbi:3 like protein [Verticillium longisporum]|nr:3 like protein [Verticillium longisporum]